MKLRSFALIFSLLLVLSVFSVAVASAQSNSCTTLWCKLLSLFGLTGKVTAGISGYTAEQCPSGMISYWEAENNAQDSFGSNNGVANGGLTYAAGKVGQAFNLNGASYVSKANPAGFPTGNSQFTMALWIKFNTLVGYPIGYGTPGSSGTLVYLYPNAGIISVDWWQIAGPATTTHPVTNQWYFLVTTYDGSNAKIYLDGNLQDTDPIGSNLGNAAVTIGGYAPGSGLFNGLVDEVAFFNRALSASEISALYAKTSGGTSGYCAAAPPTIPTCGAGDTLGMISYWKMDEAVSPSGTTVEDLMGSKNGKNTGLVVTQGKVGNALKQPDPSIETACVVLGNTQFPIGHNSYSIEFWFNQTTLYGWTVGFGISSNGIVFGFQDGGGMGRIYHGSFGEWSPKPYNPALNQWQHIVIAYDSSTDAETLYINGVPVGSQSFPNLNIADGNDRIVSANWQGGETCSQGTPGVYDEFAIYNRALSATDVAAHYARTSGGTSGYCEVSACTPDCVGKACGVDDGCGSPCQTGTCPAGQSCGAGVCKKDVGTACSASTECASSICCGNSGSTVCAAAKCNSAVGAIKYAPDAAGCLQCRDSSGICVPQWSTSNQYCVKSGVFGVACDYSQPCNGGQYCNSANAMTSPQLA